MSEELAYYSFLPWLRQGLAAGISEADLQGAEPDSGAQEGRAALAVAVTLRTTDEGDGSTAEHEVSKTLSIMGPQDVAAIGSEAFVRTYPRAGVNNFESNGLPYIEFYQEDFLWRFSPATASGSGGTETADRLTPWLALFVLEDGEYTLTQPATGLAYISLDPGRAEQVVHAETGHWAWGHVHLNTYVEATSTEDKAAEVGEELELDPDQGLCRLLCPRKLVANSSYTAFLVPAFMTGRLAGIGEDWSGVKAQQMAWSLADFATSTFARPYDFPVYHSWSFLTGEAGDFESLVAALVPTVVDSDAGTRTMDISAPGYGLDGFAITTTLGMEGALVPPDFSRSAFPATGDEPFVERLQQLVNLQLDKEDATVTIYEITDNAFTGDSDALDPMVTPPMVGRWHGLATRLETGDSNHDWLHDLNEDPRHRAAAGLGAQVVVKNQEEFMKQAWEQVGEVLSANAKIRQTRLAERVNKAIYQKHLGTLSTSHLMGMTKGMQGKVLQDGLTVRQTVSESLTPGSALSGAFRRVTRPGKRSTATLNAQAATDGFQVHQKVVEHFNTTWGEANALRTAKPFGVTAAAVSATTASTAIAYSVANYQASDLAMAQDDFFNAIEGENFNVALDKTSLKAQLTSTGDALTLAEALVDGIVDNSVLGSGIKEVVIEEEAFKDVFGEDVTGKTQGNYQVRREPATTEATKITPATTLAELQAYEAEFNAFATNTLGAMVAVTESNPVTDIDATAETLLGALDPMLTVGAALRSTITVFNPATGEFDDLPGLDPVMAYPEIQEPMYTRLLQLSKKYIYPGIDAIPDNAITLLETNQAFIEAFLAGMNHEMARELLWREYPTDQRGSYFRQFWDVEDNVFEEDAEMLCDIAPMQDWENALGGHATRTEGQLVLLIRGQLFKKYPNTVVYAQMADFDTDPEDPRILSDETDPNNIKMPIFQATLEPDVNIFGFSLSAEDAKGDRENSIPGWFFVIKERPGQVCFGLDDYTPANPTDPTWPSGNPDTWDDMSWEHLVSSEEELVDYHLDLGSGVVQATHATGDPEWGKNAADMASILFQNPVFYARHAQEMLPD